MKGVGPALRPVVPAFAPTWHRRELSRNMPRRASIAAAPITKLIRLLFRERPNTLSLQIQLLEFLYRHRPPQQIPLQLIAAKQAQ